MYKTPKISVIVPFFNVASYLMKCLNSLKDQKFKNFEVLMIDDASTDLSTPIAKNFSENNDNFFYHLIKKSGQGGARNYGISIARGEYLAFVDSDDCVTDEYLLKLYEAAEKNDADMVTCNYAKYFLDEDRYRPMTYMKTKPGVYTSEQIKRRLISDFTMRSYPWNKLFRKKLFTENNITFPKMYFEDVATIIRLAHFANKIAVIEDTLYHYTIRNDSIITTCIVGKYNDYSKAFLMNYNFIASLNERHKYLRSIIWSGMQVIFFNGYSVVRMHYFENSIKGLFSNLLTSFQNVFTAGKVGFHPADEFPNPTYLIKHPDHFKGKKQEDRFIFTYSEEEAVAEKKFSNKKVKKKKKQKVLY